MGWTFSQDTIYHVRTEMGQNLGFTVGRWQITVNVNAKLSGCRLKKDVSISKGSHVVSVLGIAAPGRFSLGRFGFTWLDVIFWEPLR